MFSVFIESLKSLKRPRPRLHVLRTTGYVHLSIYLSVIILSLH